MCGGQDGEWETAVHAMCKIFQDPDIEAAVLVDATNAFKSINHQAALHIINIIWPLLLQVLINTYRSPIWLFVTESGEISSTEGTTQGDPLAMAMYALAISPLTNKLKQVSSDVKQV